ncbi:MAG: HAD-IIA family hydrolase [Spirochaetota bacterium]
MNRDLLKNIRCFILDMDGTIYLGSRVFDFTIPFLSALTASGREYLFLTNNSSLSAADYVKKLERLGIPAGKNGVITSGDATIEHLKNAGLTRVFLMGTESLMNDFKHNGFTLTDDKPAAVVLGFDTTITYEKIRTANDLLLSGTPFYATHPDLVCPYLPHPIPDTGAMIKMFEASSGVSPIVIGKPNAPMASAIMRRYGYSLDEIAMVGDRLYTDVKFGLNNGFASILVLSGETDSAMLGESGIAPDHVFSDIGEMGRILGIGP